MGYTIYIEIVESRGHKSRRFGVLSTTLVSIPNKASTWSAIVLGYKLNLRFYIFEPVVLGFVVFDDTLVASP